MNTILENMSDDELLEIVDELQKESWSDDSIVRTLANQYFGKNGALEIMLLSTKLLPIVAERLKSYLNTTPTYLP